MSFLYPERVLISLFQDRNVDVNLASDLAEQNKSQFMVEWLRMCYRADMKNGLLETDINGLTIKKLTPEDIAIAAQDVIQLFNTENDSHNIRVVSVVAKDIEVGKRIGLLISTLDNNCLVLDTFDTRDFDELADRVDGAARILDENADKNMLIISNVEIPFSTWEMRNASKTLYSRGYISSWDEVIDEVNLRMSSGGFKSRRKLFAKFANVKGYRPEDIAGIAALMPSYDAESLEYVMRAILGDRESDEHDFAWATAYYGVAEWDYIWKAYIVDPMLRPMLIKHMQTHSPELYYRAMEFLRETIGKEYKHAPTDFLT